MRPAGSGGARSRRSARPRTLRPALHLRASRPRTLHGTALVEHEVVKPPQRTQSRSARRGPSTSHTKPGPRGRGPSMSFCHFADNPARLPNRRARGLAGRKVSPCTTSPTHSAWAAQMESLPPSGLPQRSRPVHLPAFDSGNRAIIVFLTVCTKDRAPLLANRGIHEIILKSWQAAKHWRVGRYVIMPDHVHLFCAPATTPAEPLAGWVSFWKRMTSRAAGANLWQRDFWDTQLRRHESYAAKWNYVRENPVRAGLVARAEAWAFQGELNSLAWHD